MRMAGGSAVGDHRHRLARRVARPVLDLDVEDRRQAAQALRAYAQRVDLVEDLDPQGFDIVGRSPRFQLTHVDRLHQALLGKQHAVLSRAANPDSQHARRAPAGAHLREHFKHPVDDIVAGVHHLELRFVFAAAAFGRNIDRYLVARHHRDSQHAGRVVAGVAAGECRVRKHRGAKFVFRVQVGLAHTFIDDFLERQARFQSAFLPPFDHHIDDAGILADRAVALGTHPAVGQDLRDRVLGGRTLFSIVGLTQRADVIHWMIVADILQRIGHAFDKIRFTDCHHIGHCNCS